MGVQNGRLSSHGSRSGCCHKNASRTAHASGAYIYVHLAALPAPTSHCSVVLRLASSLDFKHLLKTPAICERVNRDRDLCTSTFRLLYLPHSPRTSYLSLYLHISLTAHHPPLHPEESSSLVILRGPLTNRTRLPIVSSRRKHHRLDDAWNLDTEPEPRVAP